MLRQHFFIDEYDWEIYAFYYVEDIHRNYLYRFLEDFNYTQIIGDIDIIIGVPNCGYCYTNYNNRRSVIIVNIANSNEQLCNTIVHELSHVGSHIEEYYRIDPHSEEAAYLIGNLAQKVFHSL